MQANLCPSGTTIRLKSFVGFILKVATLSKGVRIFGRVFLLRRMLFNHITQVSSVISYRCLLATRVPTCRIDETLIALPGRGSLGKTNIHRVHLSPTTR